MKCRPGDLAVLIRGEESGAFVEVVQRAPDHPRTGLPAWECRALAPMMVWHIASRSGVVKGSALAKPGEPVYIMDKDLQPIRPPKTPIATREPENATT